MLFKALINYSFEIFGTESKIFEKIRFLPGLGCIMFITISLHIDKTSHPLA